MNRLRMGVVGVGHLGRHHARILAGIEGVELVGVADSRLEQARTVAEPLGVAAFDDYRELLERIDAVSIATPTFLHHPIASAFLDRGIPTLVEKPLAASAAEAEALVRLAALRGTLLQVGHIERFNPALKALEPLQLRPKYIDGERLGIYTFRSTDIGVVHDLMIHDLDLLSALVPAAVRSVSAVGICLFGGHEDVANARIEFEDGCVATLTASRASAQALRKMRIWGEQGYASLDFATRKATLMRPSDRLRQGELDMEGVDLSQPVAVKEHIFSNILHVDHVPAPESREPLALELEDFVQAIRTGSAPKVSGADALRSMRLADQILRSMENHQWEGRSDGPIGPARAITPGFDPSHGLPRPKSWRYVTARRGVPPQS